MSEPKTSFSNIGLRHVLEDAIAILLGKHVDQQRRDYVLGDVLQLCQDAERGSQIASQRSLFIRSADEFALMRFSFIDRYLDFSTREQLMEQLRNLTVTLDALRRNKPIEPESRNLAVKFLEEFKQNLRRRGNMEPSARSDAFAERY